MMALRRVEDNRPALNHEQLHELGNDLSRRARIAAIDAVRVSMCSEFIEKRVSIGVADIRRWRARAREALAAWREVESLTTELLNELERSVGAR